MALWPGRVRARLVSVNHTFTPKSMEKGQLKLEVGKALALGVSLEVGTLFSGLRYHTMSIPVNLIKVIRNLKIVLLCA